MGDGGRELCCLFYHNRNKVYSSDDPCGRHGGGGHHEGGVVVMEGTVVMPVLNLDKIASLFLLCYTWPRTRREFFYDTRF
jgi:hypothetical protein